MDGWGITVAEAEQAARESALWIRGAGIKAADVPDLAALWRAATTRE